MSLLHVLLLSKTDNCFRSNQRRALPVNSKQKFWTWVVTFTVSLRCIRHYCCWLIDYDTFLGFSPRRIHIIHTMKMKNRNSMLLCRPLLQSLVVALLVLLNGVVAIQDARLLREIVTTTACRNIRQAEDYPARLDMIYVYFLDYAVAVDDNQQHEETSSLDLSGIERAIATSVASTLNRCDTQKSQPVYAVELSDSSAHKVIATDDCFTCSDVADTPGIKRSVIRGITSILLGDGASGVDEMVYSLIRATLRDTFYLRQYTSIDLLKAVFNRTIAENQIVLAPDDDDNGDNSEDVGSTSDSQTNNKSRGTAWIAIAAAFISFSLTSLFLYGLYKHQKKQEGGPDTATKERVARIQAKRRHYFQQLEEDPSYAPGWMVTDTIPVPPQPNTVTWSVSDLTSDAESIIGSLPLDRIDEENSKESIEEEDLEAQLSDATFRTSPLPSNHSPVHIDHLQFIAQWSDMHEPPSEIGSYAEEEAKVEDSGYFDTLDEGSDSPLNQSARPFWLEQESIEASTVGEEAETPTVPLQGCQFVTEEDESGVEGDDEGGYGENSTTLELSDDEKEDEDEGEVDETISPKLSIENSAPFRTSEVNEEDESVKEMNYIIDEDDDLAAFTIPSAQEEYQMPLTDISNVVEEEAAEADSSTKEKENNDGNESELEPPAVVRQDSDLATWARGVITSLKENVQLLTYESNQE